MNVSIRLASAASLLWLGCGGSDGRDDGDGADDSGGNVDCGEFYLCYTDLLAPQ
jgi:hypothetical protein